jgi:hypothetical protein
MVPKVIALDKEYLSPSTIPLNRDFVLFGMELKQAMCLFTMFKQDFPMTDRKKYVCIIFSQISEN